MWRGGRGDYTSRGFARGTTSGMGSFVTKSLFLRHKHNSNKKMTDKNLIKQLKSLKTVAPQAQWGVALKQDILGTKKQEGYFMSFQTNWHFLKPASLIGGLSVACLLIVVAFLGTMSNAVDYTEISQLSSSLGELEASLNNVAINLQAKDATNASEALEIQQAINTAMKQGKEAVAQAKSKSKNIQKDTPISQEFLAVLDRVETALQAMDQNSAELERQTAQREIDQLAVLTLNENQKKLLEKAKEYYAKASYQQALITIVELSYTK